MSYMTLVIAPQTQIPPNSNCSNPNRHYRRRTNYLLQKCRNVNHISTLHADVIKNGQEHDHFIVFELLRTCAKYNAIDYALKIFQQTRDPNVYLYTALIDGLVFSGSYYHGVSIYLQMIENFVFPDNFVICSVLKACGLQHDFKFGKELHSQALKCGLCSNREVKLKLLELYGKCGEFGDMRKVFDEMPDRDVVAMTMMISSYYDHKLVERAWDVFESVKDPDIVCWTAMIDGLVRNGEMNKALNYFRQMQSKGVRANEVTIVCVLGACAHLGALELGEWIHSYVEKYDIKINHFLGSALINMYSRCGSIENAEEVFKGMKEREVSTYNSMIVGFALNGKSVEAVEVFKAMISEGTRPTNITFVGVLNACSHGGLVDFGLDLFRKMEIDYGIEPQIEHYGCVAGLLGRVGRIEEAYEFIKNMKISPDHIIWVSLLSACYVHRNYEIGEHVVKILLNHGCSDIGTYVLLSNFYSSWGKWEDALLVRTKLKESGAQKEPGCSLIEVDREIHEFLLGDIRHPQRKAIYQKLAEIEQILRMEGYDPQVEVISQDIAPQEKEQALAIHSERLAICYGLISTQPHTTLRVVKNLRVCNDCHTIVKLISKVTGRKIIMRDRNRFHHFENGSCSCDDYW